MPRCAQLVELREPARALGLDEAAPAVASVRPRPWRSRAHRPRSICGVNGADALRGCRAGGASRPSTPIIAQAKRDRARLDAAALGPGQPDRARRSPASSAPGSSSRPARRAAQYAGPAVIISLPARRHRGRGDRALLRRAGGDDPGRRLAPTPTPTRPSARSSPGSSAGTCCSSTCSRPRPWRSAGPATSTHARQSIGIHAAALARRTRRSGDDPGVVNLPAIVDRRC